MTDVVIRVYDDNYRVLRKHRIEREIDFTLPRDFLSAALAYLLVQLSELGRALENEPMDRVRLEVWDAGEREKLLDYAGGLVTRA